MEEVMPSHRHSSAMLSSPRKPSSTMRILSSAEKGSRVASRMALTFGSQAILQAGPRVGRIAFALGQAGKRSTHRSLARRTIPGPFRPLLLIDVYGGVETTSLKEISLIVKRRPGAF